MRGMNATDTAREARSRNLARLRKLTIGTAALSVAATSGFGWLAAMSTAASAAASSSTITAAAAANASTTSGTASSTLFGTAVAPATGSISGTAHVSSGGS